MASPRMQRRKMRRLRIRINQAAKKYLDLIMDNLR
jgi:hypothetical protein